MRALTLATLTALIAASVPACGDGAPGSPGTAAPSPPAATSPAATSPSGTSPSSSTPRPPTTTTAPPVTTPTTVPIGRTIQSSVYLLAGERLVPVARRVDATAPAAASVRALLEGPDAAERAAGLTSTVPAGTRLLGLSLRGDLATVDLSGTFASGGGSLSMTARLAQVVFTLTRFPSVRRVAFRLDGVPVTAFGGEGIVLDGPVGRDRFEDLSPAVLVEAPLRGATVGSPLRVHGTANTFEAVFWIEVVDGAGRTVAHQPVMASSGSGTRGVFDVTLRFTAAPGPGRVVAGYDSPRDGARVVVAETPVVLR